MRGGPGEEGAGRERGRGQDREGPRSGAKKVDASPSKRLPWATFLAEKVLLMLQQTIGRLLHTGHPRINSGVRSHSAARGAPMR